MESQATFVRPKSAVELYSESSVYMNFPFVVYPWYSENNLSFWLYNPFKDFCIQINRVPLEKRYD